MNSLGGLVLCGGASSRMGQPKAWLTFEGEPLLVRVVARLASACAPIVVVSAREQALPTLPEGVTRLTDEHPDRGPLEGLAVGLAALGRHVPRAFVATVDAPFLAPAFIECLASFGDADAIVPDAFGKRHPLTAVYATRSAAVARTLVDAGERRVTTLVGALSTRVVTHDDLLADPRIAAADPHLSSLVNVNTPADYERALAALQVTLSRSSA